MGTQQPGQGKLEALDESFRRRVYDIVRLIPYGQVATYGFVALLAGMPRHARQVGWALHTLPGELAWGVGADVRRRGHREMAQGVEVAQEAALGRVPWQRVVNAQGRVSTHPDEYGTRRQIELLRAEGIEVTEDGTLVAGLEAHHWRPDPATLEALELPAEVLFAVDRQLND
jgi:methylated-DNA-protein-cysteine methyltransferase-like protein